MIEIILQAERALAVGQLDQAERLYRQAADADPRNAIAVVGLARVALDRGDDRAARSLAKRALAIDPENSTAQRLVERLEEVMRFRGEEPPADAAPPVGDTVGDAVGGEVGDAQEASPPPRASTQAHERRSLLDRIRRRR